jgi:polyphosphate kinase
MGTDLEEMDTITARNYSRNARLIDLSFTPDTIREKVMEQFDSQTNRDRSKLLNYFIANKLKNLTDHLSEF